MAGPDEAAADALARRLRNRRKVFLPARTAERLRESRDVERDRLDPMGFAVAAEQVHEPGPDLGRPEMLRDGAPVRRELQGVPIAEASFGALVVDDVEAAVLVLDQEIERGLEQHPVRASARRLLRGLRREQAELARVLLSRSLPRLGLAGREGASARSKSVASSSSRTTRRAPRARPAKAPERKRATPAASSLAASPEATPSRTSAVNTAPGSVGSAPGLEGPKLEHAVRRAAE